MEVQFKVYALLGGSKPEVRRFTIEQGVVTSYQYLLAKLEDVFPALRNKTYKIYWKDDEGDDIRISSDTELIISLNDEADIHKLYVEVEQTKIQPDIEIDMAFAAPTHWPENEFGAVMNGVHLGVVCDGCEGAVIGFRYRCTVCRDFDLCSKCEALCKHPDHCMLRIPSPLIQGHEIRSKIKRARHMRSMFTEEHCTDKAAEATECPFMKKQKRDKDHHHRRHGSKARSSWLDTVAAYVNEFANLAGDIGTGTAPSSFAQNSGQQPSTSGQQSTTSGQQTATSGQQSTTSGQQSTTSGQQVTNQQKASATNFQNGDAPQSNASQANNTSTESNDVPIVTQYPLNPERIAKFIEIQKSIGAAIQEAGKIIQEDETVANLRQSDANEMNVVLTPDQSTTNLTTNNPIDSQKTFNSANSQTSDSHATHNPTLSQTTGNPANSQPSVSSTTSHTIARPAENESSPNNTIGQLQGMTGSDNKSAERQANAADKTDGWTVINNEDIVYTSNPSAPEPQMMAVGFKELSRNLKELAIDDSAGIRVFPTPTSASTPTSSSVSSHVLSSSIPMPAPGFPHPPAASQAQPIPRKPHPNPRIEASLSQMLGMGFTNDGGWLAQLLESKNGNIGAVLDLLTPVTVQRQS